MFSVIMISFVYFLISILSGHEAYAPNTEGFKAVVSEFGNDIVGESGEIDRKKLGPIVFSDKVNL